MISMDSFYEASRKIKPLIQRTPLVLSHSLTQVVGDPVYLKLECLQTTGSFKLRGATNAILNLSDHQKQRGVTCVSTGNHGRGLAYAAKQNNIKAIICMGSLVPQNKIDGILAQGTEVRIIGNSQDDAQIEVDRLVADEGMTSVTPFDHPDIIAGQGTIGIEILNEINDFDTIAIPLSGGGLCGGIAFAVKQIRPDIRIVGVSMERGCAMQQSMAAGKPVPVEELATLADALGGGIGLDNQYTFKLIQEFVDEIILVSELEIAEAIRHAYFNEQQIIEGSGAVGIAALLTNKIIKPGKTAVILSGKNIDMSLHHKIISGQMPNIED